YRRSAGRDRTRSLRRDSGGVVLQLPHRAPRILQRRDGQLVVGAGRLLHQEDRVVEDTEAEGRSQSDVLPFAISGVLELWPYNLVVIAAESNPTSTSPRSWTSCWCCSSS